MSNSSNNSNDYVMIRCRLSNNTNELLKIILDKLGITQQDFMESLVKDFVFANSKIIVDRVKKEKN